MKQKEKPLDGSELSWRDWLKRYYSDVANRPMAPRHVSLWEWFDSLKRGVQPKARIEVWPRGGAKSTSGELGVARLCATLARRFVLYVSGTQEKQADPHVQNVSAWLERLGVERAVNKYGNSRGYKASLLRTANGFNVAALGLDAASRGVKLDQYRPDLIIFDDIDSQDDSADTIEKKINIITSAIAPTGSPDCAFLFLQNMVHDEGVVARIVDGRADFFRNRESPTVEPAVYNLETELYDRGDGQQIYRITGGAPSWEGQNLAVCEGQINLWGLSAFRREAQHEVGSVNGVFFRQDNLTPIAPADVPDFASVCLAGDLAATEGAGDHTVFFLLGKAKNATYYVLAIIRGQWSAERVRDVLRLACNEYLPKYRNSILRLPQDPAQAGKDQKQQIEKEFARWSPIIRTVSGDKAKRAEGQQKEINKGNFYLVNQDLPECFRPYCDNLSYVAWHNNMKNEYRLFREDESQKEDDQVDAGSDAYNVLENINQSAPLAGRVPAQAKMAQTYHPM